MKIEFDIMYILLTLITLAIGFAIYAVYVYFSNGSKTVEKLKIYDDNIRSINSDFESSNKTLDTIGDNMFRYKMCKTFDVEDTIDLLLKYRKPEKVKDILKYNNEAAEYNEKVKRWENLTICRKDEISRILKVIDKESKKPNNNLKELYNFKDYFVRSLKEIKVFITVEKSNELSSKINEFVKLYKC